ncbi:MAG: DUF2231 domain-containing protein [Gemmatimonadota bacterium]|nr:DUF2231 domain-containing protein [Gemmatimonadota bacterium]
MLPNPLHPAIVHMPLAVAVLLPLAALVALWVSGRTDAKRAVWGVIVALVAILAVSSRVAIQTGEAQEEVVERVVTHDALEEHEEAGERLFVGSLIVLAVSALGLVGGRVGTVARPASAAGALVLLALAIGVGRSGGELVYEHGAASAYASPSVPAVAADYRDDHDDR